MVSKDEQKKGYVRTQRTEFRNNDKIKVSFLSCFYLITNIKMYKHSTTFM